jgi:hypothetical protein
VFDVSIKPGAGQGAWDGVDAYDLDAAEDGTVIGFPMLVRGLVDLPDDPVEFLP